MSGQPALRIVDLSIGFPREGEDDALVVKSVRLEVDAGQIHGLAGESGCGKTTTALAAVGYPPPGSRVRSGSSWINGVDMLGVGLEQRRRIWGSKVGFVAQNAASSLNPAIPVGRQLAQVLKLHTAYRGAALTQRQIELFAAVGIPHPEHSLKKYAHQFSGGQQQRIALAIAIACRPDLLILDEPTTGLDVTTQAHMSALLRGLLEQTGMAALYVSHDLALLASLADRLSVMYAGEIVEAGPMRAVIDSPRHPYTRALLAAVPDAGAARDLTGIPGRPPTSAARVGCSFAPRCPNALDACITRAIPLTLVAEDHFIRCINPDGNAQFTRATGHTSPTARASNGKQLLDVNGLTCHYRGASRAAAVSNVSFVLARAETIGIVGESGSGKSTLLRALGGLHPPSHGSVLFDGQPLAGRAVKRSRTQRRDIQIVFQNPDSSLNPRMTIEQILRRPLRLFRPDVNRSSERAHIAHLLDDVQLPSTTSTRYPGELSGGQRQRIALARAFAARPKLILADEVTSSLDVSVQATVLQLLRELASVYGTALVFVSHDLAVIRNIAPRALVMRNSEVCEEGSTRDLFESPQNPYTRDLVAAIPKLHQGRVS